MIGEIAQLLDNLALIVGAFLDDLSGLFGARGLVFRFVVGGLLSHGAPLIAAAAAR
jgi:hypothetical protein